MSALKVCPQCGTEYPANARFCEIDGTALRSASGGADLLGTVVADRYHILKKLGEGGMGQVYLAEHVKMGRKSALKIMHPGMKADVDAISRFNREAANASRIAHSNVAAVYDFGETPDGIIYLAMEYIDGQPLTQIIESEGALAPTRAAEIVRQTAEALAVAHDMGIVHRDLKPDNIMIAKNRDGSDCVKVVDFGIAKAAGNDAQKVTKTGLVVGTPDYMSPEQLSGDKLDGRSDIYSLALVAFNMLTGTLPFPSDSAQESMIMRLTDKPKTLAAMRPDIAWPADVQAVMDKALERDVTRRYQTAIEFGVALYTAVGRMSEGKAGAAAAATPSAASSATPDVIPSTRIADARAQGNGGAADDASVDLGALAQRTAPAKKNRGVMMAVGGVVVIVILGAVAFKMSGRNASPTPPGNVAAQPTPSTPTPSTPTPATSAPSGTNAAPSAEQGVASRGAGKSVADQLRALLDASNDATKGTLVLSRVRALDLKTSEELYLGATLRSNVAAAKGDTTAACKTFRDVMPKLAQDEADKAANRMSNVLSCPR